MPKRKEPSTRSRLHFVAFLDILGFSDMVASDQKGEGQENLTKLFRCHQSAAVVFRDDVNCSTIQFSDSIVIAMPYEKEKFDWFIRRVADYQRLLLDERLLCRGGIAVNSHFSNGSFTFSAGLIQAYRVESQSARYPRVVISKDVLDLVYPARTRVPAALLEEDDGLAFVDYLGVTKGRRPKLLSAAVQDLVTALRVSESASVREKGVWLAAYSDAALGTEFSQPRFRGGSVRLRGK